MFLRHRSLHFFQTIRVHHIFLTKIQRYFSKPSPIPKFMEISQQTRQKSNSKKLDIFSSEQTYKTPLEILVEVANNAEQMPLTPAGSNTSITSEIKLMPLEQGFKQNDASDISSALSDPPPLKVEENVVPKKKGKKKVAKRTKAELKISLIDQDNNEKEGYNTVTKPRRPRSSHKRVIEEGQEEVVEISKRRKRRKTPEEDREYLIAPIDEVLPTTFRGRLGYACMNTILRKRKPPVFCARTCRIETIRKEGLNYVKELGRQNVKDLCELIRWNEANNIKFMRMSSEMFPFASHAEYGYTLEYADKELREAGELANKFGHRLTTHPGQYTQLSSPKENVVQSSIKELEYHCEILNRMNLGRDSIMIIHMGGTYGDKAAALERFKLNYLLLSDNIKDRLVLENDELCYNVDDLLPICQELNIPLVFDYHHDWLFPSKQVASELIPLINETWHRKGIRPKQHYSEPRPGTVTVMERRAHSDRVKRLPEFVPDDMDLMLECKDKEQACLYLYRLHNLYPVNPRILRPPAEIETMHTQGRKSNKRKKAKEELKEAAEDDYDIVDAEEIDVDASIRGTKKEENEGIISECGSMEDHDDAEKFEDNEELLAANGRLRSRPRYGKTVEVGNKGRTKKKTLPKRDRVGS